VHRTLGAFGHDIMHSVLHFDGKIWRTLPMLFWNPGELTRRYVHGERAKFVSPLALFLFSVFLTFAAFTFLLPGGDSVNTALQADHAEKEYQADRKTIIDDITKLEAEKKEWIANGTPGYEWMDGEIARHQRDLKALEEGRGKELRVAELVGRKMSLERSQSATRLAELKAQLDAARKAGKPTAQIEEALEAEKLKLSMLDNAAHTINDGADGDDKRTFTIADFPGSDRLNRAAEKAAKNPQLLLYKMQSNAYKYSWALIPISVPFVWLLFFWRRRFKIFDHAVFVTYSISFMMLLVVISGLLVRFPTTEAIGGLALAFLPPIHMYRQLHHAYETSRFGAFWRACLLSLFALFALTLFAFLILTLGVTG
jgi:hypothetical protein